MDAPVLTLDVIHTDAFKKLQQLRDSNRISVRDYDMITGTHTLHDLDALFLAAASPENENRHSLRKLTQSILFRFERFGRALDMLAQSSPAILGVNVLGFIWGTLRFVITVRA